jgi:hypothetical protein
VPANSINCRTFSLSTAGAISPWLPFLTCM